MAATDVRAYRQAIGRFATGVSIITAVHDGRCYAMTANALTSVSLDPILLLVCFMRDSDTGAAIRSSGFFGLNILEATRGETIARRCARKLEPGEDQLEGLELVDGPQGLPLIAGCLGHVVCRVERILEAGDHNVVIASVEEFEESDTHEADPIVFFAGRFWRLSPLA